MKLSSRGFTLLEVLVALGILSGTLMVVSGSWSGNLLRVRKSNLYNNAALLLESKMSELLAKYNGRPLEEIPEEISGDFGTDYKQYRWDFKTQKFEMPDLSSVFIKQGEGDQMLLTIIKTTQDYISEAVVEGTLTVYVKGAGKKEVAFSVSTYFVDYNKELAVGGI